MQSHSGMPCSRKIPFNEGMPFRDHCGPCIDSITHWHESSPNFTTIQRSDEEVPETTLDPAMQAPEVSFSPPIHMDQSGMPLLGRGNQFTSLSGHDNREIVVERHTLQKAEQNPHIDVVVYECRWDEHGNPCRKWVEGNAKEIRTHLRNYHAVNGPTKDPTQCKWSNCTDELKYGSIPRHIMTHLKVTFRCSICQLSFAREDCIQSHRKTIDKCANSENIVTHGPEARLIVVGHEPELVVSTPVPAIRNP
ncbi:hypothetical protein V8B97DRAFT_450746 [Scleroderma yunnanense]